jgi:TonB family protein
MPAPTRIFEAMHNKIPTPFFRRFRRDSIAPIIILSLLFHAAFVGTIVLTSKAMYRSREFERPQTFDLIKLSQIFEVPAEQSKAVAPKIKTSTPKSMAQPQPVVAPQPQPTPVEEKNPVPSETKTAPPVSESASAPQTPAATSSTKSTSSASEAGTIASLDHVYEAGMVDQQPTAIKRIEPFYPEFVKDQGVAGIVRAQVTIDEKGNVMEVKILSSPHELLSDEVMKAVSRWKYNPGRFKGVPVKVKDRPIEIEFKLD